MRMPCKHIDQDCRINCPIKGNIHSRLQVVPTGGPRQAPRPPGLHVRHSISAHNIGACRLMRVAATASFNRGHGVHCPLPRRRRPAPYDRKEAGKDEDSTQPRAGVNGVAQEYVGQQGGGDGLQGEVEGDCGRAKALVGPAEGGGGRGNSKSLFQTGCRRR